MYRPIGIPRHCTLEFPDVTLDSSSKPGLLVAGRCDLPSFRRRPLRKAEVSALWLQAKSHMAGLFGSLSISPHLTQEGI